MADSNKSRCAMNPERRARYNARINDWQKAKYASDPEYRALKIAGRVASEKAKCEADPAYHAQRKIKDKARYKVKIAHTPLEAAIEGMLCEGVLMRGGLCPKVVDKGRRGFPDRLVILPGHPTYFVELKRPKLGKLASWQSRYHTDLRAAGQKVWVLWNEEDIARFFVEIDLV
jgi:hypothetical protein